MNVLPQISNNGTTIRNLYTMQAGNRQDLCVVKRKTMQNPNYERQHLEIDDLLTMFDTMQKKSKHKMLLLKQTNQNWNVVNLVGLEKY